MMKRYLIILLTLVVASSAAIAYYNYYISQSSLSDTARVRMTVTGFGDELKMVPTTADHQIFVAAMNTYYAKYIEPTLLNKWNALPETALGRATSSPSPDRIDITDMKKNANGTYTVHGNILETARGADGTNVVVHTIPAEFILTMGPDGWQITSARKL